MKRAIDQPHLCRSEAATIWLTWWFDPTTRYTFGRFIQAISYCLCDHDKLMCRGFKRRIIYLSQSNLWCIHPSARQEAWPVGKCHWTGKHRWGMLVVNWIIISRVHSEFLDPVSKTTRFINWQNHHMMLSPSCVLLYVGWLARHLFVAGTVTVKSQSVSRIMNSNQPTNQSVTSAPFVQQKLQVHSSVWYPFCCCCCYPATTAGNCLLVAISRVGRSIPKRVLGSLSAHVSP